MSQTIVPYGFGVGDFLDVGSLARSFYQAYRDAPDECRQLAAEAKQLDGLLSSLKDVVSILSLSSQQQEQLADHLAGCKGVLQEMRATLEPCRVSDTDHVPWHRRIRWDNNALLQLRVRLTAQLSMLQALYTTWGQLAVLNALHTSSRSGTSPSASSLSKASDVGDHDNPTEWAQIISPLEDLGITAAIAVAHKDLILTFFTNANIVGTVGEEAKSEAGNVDPEGHDTARTMETWLTEQGRPLTRSNTGSAMSNVDALSECSALESDDAAREEAASLQCEHKEAVRQVLPVTDSLPPLLTKQQRSTLEDTLWKLRTVEYDMPEYNTQVRSAPDVPASCAPQYGTNPGNRDTRTHSSASSHANVVDGGPTPDLEKGMLSLQQSTILPGGNPSFRGNHGNMVGEKAILYRDYTSSDQSTVASILLIEKQRELDRLERLLDAISTERSTSPSTNLEYRRLLSAIQKKVNEYDLLLRGARDIFARDIAESKAGTPLKTAIEYCLSRLDQMLRQRYRCQVIVRYLMRPEFRLRALDEGVYHFPPVLISRITSIIIMYVIITLLVVPVGLMCWLSISAVPSPVEVVGILLVFTLLFCGAMSALTRARPSELFAASSAYCAVLVVFMSNVDIVFLHRQL